MWNIITKDWFCFELTFKDQTTNVCQVQKKFEDRSQAAIRNIFWFAFLEIQRFQTIFGVIDAFRNTTPVANQDFVQKSSTEISPVPVSPTQTNDVIHVFF